MAVSYFCHTTDIFYSMFKTFLKPKQIHFCFLLNWPLVGPCWCNRKKVSIHVKRPHLSLSSIWKLFFTNESVHQSSSWSKTLYSTHFQLNWILVDEKIPPFSLIEMENITFPYIFFQRKDVEDLSLFFKGNVSLQTSKNKQHFLRLLLQQFRKYKQL